LLPLKEAAVTTVGLSKQPAGQMLEGHNTEIMLGVTYPNLRLIRLWPRLEQQEM
jgi:hypothetical protein